MRKFTIITGYPRSRLAWLSVFLMSPPNIFAFHEATIGCSDIDAYMKKINREENFVVDCNCAFIPATSLLKVVWDRMEANGIEFQLIVVEREFDKCASSLSRSHPSIKMDWGHLVDNMSIVKGMSGPDVIPYVKLDDPGWMEHLMDQCSGGTVDFSLDRFNELKTKNIQQHSGKTIPSWH